MKRSLIFFFILINNLIVWTTVSHIYFFFFAICSALILTPVKILNYLFWGLFVFFWWNLILDFNIFDEIFYFFLFFLK